MAAFTAPCATADTTTRSVRWTSWQKQGSEEEEGKCESEDMTQRTVLEKTHEFFQMCDIENKGFISRRDMQRLNGRLPFSAEELENVFDVLDSDSNGYLTLDEFSSGFSDFLFGQRIPVEEDMGEKNRGVSPPEVLYQSQRQESLVTGEEDEEEEHFSMLMDSLGANSVFEDPAEVRSLWAQLQRDEPHLLSNFEDFLARVTSQIIEANQEKKEMESALKRKVATHGDEIQHLYEEMEQQIKNEKERIALQDHERFLSRRRDLELQLSGKERELEQLSQKQRRLERQCQDLHSEHHETKEEIVKLKQTNDELTRELEHTSQELMLAQDQLSLLQEQSTRLHEEKEMEIYKETEGLQRERASLLKQLDLLREMNKHLRNEKDIRYQNSEQAPGVKQRLSINAVKLNTSNMKSVDEELTVNSRRHSLTNGSCQRRGHLQRIISIEEDHLPHLLQMDHQVPSLLQECSEGEEATEEDNDIELVMSDIIPPASSTPQQEQQKSKREEGVTPTFPRGQPVGKDTSVDDGSPSPLNRLFKIVLVGNSNVGKTSFLRRFCDDCFNPGTATTLSVYHVLCKHTLQFLYRLHRQDNNSGRQPSGAADMGHSRAGEVREHHKAVLP
ncbi:EF-hand calcium-binding domain-containing protein 4B [Xyrichtys novacula]|uniref:EF-hand calcium-binding domain-containing protein 4B n=1 Tax=Xyrichtys novacula TaxID=13765 RepID=A0AAV1F795_XYRNO|nr:EF-hand calcium-binding domain-containing protein 4B [Xyrichtys novacula]